MKKILLIAVCCIIILVMNANTATAEFHQRGDETTVTGVTKDGKVYFDTDYMLSIGDEPVGLIHVTIILDIEDNSISHYSIKSYIKGGSQVGMSDELINGKEISGLLEVRAEKDETYTVHYDKETYDQIRRIESIKDLKVVNEQIYFSSDTSWHGYFDISFTLDSFDELKGRISVK